MKIMLRFNSIVAPALILCAWMAGCAGERQPQPSSASGSPPQPAPALQVRSLNSSASQLSLSDYGGKFVLVDFWATWCAPCREEVPYLKKTYEQFGNDPRFAMLSISLDRGPSAPRDYAAAHGMKWPQGFAGSPSQSADLTTRWKVIVIPAVFLVNPEGKIIASDLREEQIQEAVSRALKQN